MSAKKGDWVKVHKIVLESSERAPQVPDDTKKVPLEMWVKGYLQEDAEIGDEVSVKTMTGRIVEGTLEKVNPTYRHSFGENVPELLKIGPQLRKILFSGEDN